MSADPHADIVTMARELGLDRDIRVRHAIAVLGSTPDQMARLRISTELGQAVQRTLALNPPNPFTPPPVGLIGGRPLVVGYEATTQEPVTLGPEHVASVIAFPGAIGSGKTTLMVRLLAQMPSVKMWIIDLKDDYRSLAVANPRIVILHPDVPYNMLTPPPHLSAAQSDDLFIQTFSSSYYLGETGKSELFRALQTARANHDHICIDDLPATLEGSIRKTDTYSQRDHKQNLANELRRFSRAYPGPAKTRGGFGIGAIFERGLYLPARPLTENEEWLFTHALTHLFHYQAHHNSRGGLGHVVVSDEGVQLWNVQNAGRISEAPPLLPLLGMWRELGIGTLVSTNSWTTTHQALKSNANTLLVTRLANHEDESAIAQTIDLCPDQSVYLNRYLQPGRVIVRLPDRWREPILAVVPPVAYEKAVHPYHWQAAKARTNLLAPVSLPPMIAVPRAVSPTPTQRTHPPTRPAPVADVLDFTQPVEAPTKDPARSEGAPSAVKNRPAAPPADPVVALTPREEALLNVVCEGVTPSTAAYSKADLSLAGGDEAAKRLEQKGLILRERIVFHSGRGGHGIGLAPTPAGLARASKERRVKTRGGDSVQHQFFVQELHCALPGSTVEAMVGRKQVDLLVALDTRRHGRLLEAIMAGSPTIGSPCPPLETGALVAIEVETSDPTKTAPSNIAKNSASGLALTITAVLPSEVKALRTELATSVPSELQSRYIVVNCLDLLDHLKGDV
jgi:hypothetical protein